MTTLHIFGDEFGTMPVSDTDGVFLGAIVACRVLPSALSSWDGRRAWFLQKLSALGMEPHVAFVKPSPGYAAQLHTKIQKMTTMARYRRLADGANAAYINHDGIHARNFVWTYCMQQAIVRSFGAAAFNGRIDALRIHLDQKTMTPPERALFRRSLGTAVARLRETLSMFPREAQARSALEALQDCESEPILSWSDEIATPEFQTGLKMAHYLAKHAGENLRKKSATGRLIWLESSGFKNPSTNIAPILLGPLDREAVDRWMSATGLPEPK